MTRSPTLLLRRLFGEPPMLELPLGRFFRRAYVHAQYESGLFRVATRWRFPAKQGPPVHCIPLADARPLRSKSLTEKTPTAGIAPNIDQERDRLIAGLDLARTVL
jgi:hypothetical protein